MQEWQIQYSEMSRRDLQTIKKYITYNLKSPNTAVKQINQIIKAIDNLSFFPKRSPIYKLEPWRSICLRVLQINNYAVFYYPNVISHVVQVIRILYKKREFNTRL